jgi:hypothetical protein
MDDAFVRGSNRLPLLDFGRRRDYSLRRSLRIDERADAATALWSGLN